MRVILEMTEAESRSVTVERHVFASQEQAQAKVPTAAIPGASGPDGVPAQGRDHQSVVAGTGAALDAGAPSLALLVALGAEEGENADPMHEDEPPRASDGEGGTSAGAAPDWLRQILSRAPG